MSLIYQGSILSQEKRSKYNSIIFLEYQYLYILWVLLTSPQLKKRNVVQTFDPCHIASGIHLFPIDSKKVTLSPGTKVDPK